MKRLLEQLQLELAALFLAALWVFLRVVQVVALKGAKQGVHVHVLGKEVIHVEYVARHTRRAKEKTEATDALDTQEKDSHT